MRRLILIIAICTGVLWSGPVGADEAFASALAAYKRGDYAEAATWFRKAADQGHLSAQFSLGIMYEKGWGVPHAYVQAHKWYNLAAAQGNDTARKSRDRVAEKMTPAMVQEAQKLAREWRPKK